MTVGTTYGYAEFCEFVADALSYDSWQEDVEADAPPTFQGVVFILLVAQISIGEYADA